MAKRNAGGWGRTTRGELKHFTTAELHRPKRVPPGRVWWRALPMVARACKHLAACTLGTVPCTSVFTARPPAEQMLRHAATATWCGTAHKRALWPAGWSEDVRVRRSSRAAATSEFLNKRCKTSISRWIWDVVRDHLFGCYKEHGAKHAKSAAKQQETVGLRPIEL